MEKDKRIFQRVEGIVNVRYCVKGRDKRKLESLPRNIGGGGVGVCLTEKLSPGTVLELEITVPDDPKKTISGLGEVMWTKPYGSITSEENVSLHETGVRFVNIDPISVGRVYSYFRQRGLW
ncbi:MAG: PilZ domain-containing protein [Candidatus Omnitrophica bacterium]|nr:PilZ domain-containing protein [Candidatus Omnitrophota bacterium]